MVRTLLKVSGVVVYALGYIVLAIQMLGAGGGTAAFLALIPAWVPLFVAFGVVSRTDERFY